MSPAARASSCGGWGGSRSPERVRSLGGRRTSVLPPAEGGRPTFGRPAPAPDRRRRNLSGMCRNIRPLYNFEPPATHDEVHDAAVQFVRKVSGFTKPAKANEEAFERAVQEISAATTRLLDSLVTNAPPKDREVEAEKRRARSAERYAA